MMYFYIFCLNNSFLGFCHGDMHIGNWSINKNDKLINIYDFGYCFSISREEVDVLYSICACNEPDNIIPIENNIDMILN